MRISVSEAKGQLTELVRRAEAGIARWCLPVTARLLPGSWQYSRNPMRRLGVH